RAWAAGDAVDLTLPLRPRLVEAHPLLEETRNQVAVMRGPPGYRPQSIDLPKGPSVPTRAGPGGAAVPPPLCPGPPRGGVGAGGGAGGKGGGGARHGVGRRALSGLQAVREPTARYQTDPVLRLGKPRQVRDDRVDAFRPVTDDNDRSTTHRRFPPRRSRR